MFSLDLPFPSRDAGGLVRESPVQSIYLVIANVNAATAPNVLCVCFQTSPSGVVLQSYKA